MYRRVRLPYPKNLIEYWKLMSPRRYLHRTWISKNMSRSIWTKTWSKTHTIPPCSFSTNSITHTRCSHRELNRGPRPSKSNTEAACLQIDSKTRYLDPYYRLPISRSPNPWVFWPAMNSTPKILVNLYNWISASSRTFSRWRRSNSRWMIPSCWKIL